MKRTRVILITAMLFGALVAPGNAAGRDSLDKDAGALLESVIEHYQNGELERAWESYRTFFDDPQNRNVDVNAFGRCFYRKRCPTLGALAYILGKSETDAGDFRNFCPDWEGSDAGDLSADEIREASRVMEAFRDTALGGSCAQWVTRNAAMFQPRASGQRRVPQVVPLVFFFPEDNRPYSEVEILGTHVTAILDTAMTHSMLNRRVADQAPEAYEFIEDVQVRTFDSYRMLPLARANRIMLGSEIFSRPVVYLNELYWLESGGPGTTHWANIIGMHLLLQYDKVCFDWEGRELHLGGLGPCEDAMTAYQNWLTVSQGLAIEARDSLSNYLEVKIDTGSTTTYCSQWVMERNAGRKTFSFGSNEVLTGECTYDPDVLFIKSNRSGTKSTRNDILLGMDTLRQFGAFGWQLNPLKVYFAPKFLDSDRFDLLNSEQETSDRQD